MTTPAQARTDRAPNEIIDNDDINQLALVANRADTNANAAQETAADALEAAQSAYVLPPEGIDPASAARVLDGLVQRGTWNGTAWATRSGTVLTNANRPPGVSRDFRGGPDANAAGLMVDGDTQGAV